MVRLDARVSLLASARESAGVVGREHELGAFADELAKWGPDAPASEPLSVAEAEAYCADLARSHYENFPVVSVLLPRRWRGHFRNVYAYCRWADDLADESGDAETALERLAWWRSLLEECYASERPSTSHPVFTALHGTIRARGIPKQPFADLLSAFEQDQRVTTYESFSQLHDYCRRSANPVGRLVLHVVDAARDEFLEWSDAVCTGLQLANFWQDVARDHAIGRVYLPAEDRRRFGYDDTALHGQVENDPFRELMRFEVDRARSFLLRGLPLVDAVGGPVAPVVDLFARGGLRILERIEAIDYGVWSRRPVVSRWDVARLVVGATGRSTWRRLRGRRVPPNTRDVPTKAGR